MRLVVFAVLSLFIPGSLAADIDYGRFTNTVKVEWLRGVEGERRMRLLEEFAYIDPKGKKWIAPKGYETDGASIPKVFWSLVGAPFDGQYREAAVIHDVYCDTKTEPWQDVHRIFYYANRAAGVTESKAKLLYTAVRVAGPKWGSGKSNCFAGCHAVPQDTQIDNKGRAITAPAITEDEAKKAVGWVAERNPSLEEIDAYVQHEFPKSTFGH